MIAIAATDTPIAASYRWEASGLVSADGLGSRAGAAHRSTPTAGSPTGQPARAIDPADLPTLVFLAG